ncbi:hypothetical protein BGZ76_007694, partial [Entomortierella beljakovae]
MVDEKKELGKTAAGDVVHQDLPTYLRNVAKAFRDIAEIRDLKEQHQRLAAENQRKTDRQNAEMRAELENERQIHQKRLDQLEYDRIVSMREYKCAKEANSTIFERIRRDQREHDRKMEELTQSLRNNELAKYETDKKNAR